ncbi:TolC family outer membrane protein [Bartonella sp. DGB2]|uniref:TolC family outer membrane protein n=1 Tax=Bartonella sp. DGB2 TaxID=3388426 RepID=UPI00398FC217
MRKLIYAILAFFWVGWPLCFAHAETLTQALTQAYIRNYTINSTRASVVMADDDITIARSAYFPQVSVSATYGGKKTPFAPDDYAVAGSVGIKLDQKIFDGFSSQNIVAAASVSAQAQREFLRNTEQDIFVAAATAYADVYQYRKIAALRQENLRALDEQVRSYKAKISVGEGTQTDLAQAEAARAIALSELSLARADVQTAEAVYQRIIGVEPDVLDKPLPAAGLPETLDASYREAMVAHPAILYSRYLVEASSHSVKAQEGAMLPQIGLSASTSYDRIYQGQAKEGQTTSIGVVLQMPLFQGGRTTAQVHKAKEKAGQAQIQYDSSVAEVRQALTSSWAQLVGARTAVTAYRDSVRAAEIALNGRLQEDRVGQATTLDVLNARSQLIAAKIGLIRAERGVIVASYNVRSALGRMTADQLGISLPITK